MKPKQIGIIIFILLVIAAIAMGAYMFMTGGEKEAREMENIEEIEAPSNPEATEKQKKSFIEKKGSEMKEQVEQVEVEVQN